MTIDDEAADVKEDEVILCDGCNAEVHLRCLNLTAVSFILFYFMSFYSIALL